MYCTLKLTKFENYFCRDCTSFYVFCHLANHKHNIESFSTFPYKQKIEFAYATRPMTMDVPSNLEKIISNNSNSSERQDSSWNKNKDKILNLNLIDTNN